MKLVAVCLFVLTASAFAELQWDNPDQNILAKVTDRTVVAKYHFTNAGKELVTIEAVRTSCGCTTATLAKKDYSPGESGEIEARFEIGGRVGHQEKAILVTTKGEPHNPSVLHLVVEIPETIKVQPELVLWRVGEAAEPKTIKVTVADGSPAKILAVVTDTPTVKLSVAEGLPGKSATVTVTPNDTSRPEGATVMIKTDYPADNPEAHYAYVRIK
ncbi:MAG TPA: DUF1573 domain-containing protein [Chthoniobacterales bacterium]